jgi:hypothetical protein
LWGKIETIAIFENSQIDHKRNGLDFADFFHVAQKRVQWRVFVNTVKNLRVS